MTSVSSDSSEHKSVTNPISRVIACGLIIFVVLFGITSWRHQGKFDVSYIVLRYTLHLVGPVLLVCFLSRNKAWSYIKVTSVILVLTLGLLGITGLKPFLESGDNARIYDQLLERFCTEVCNLTLKLESAVETNQTKNTTAEIEKQFASIEKITGEIEQLPDIYDWHVRQLIKKYKPQLLKTEQRFMMAVEALMKKENVIAVNNQDLKWLLDWIRHLTSED